MHQDNGCLDNAKRMDDMQLVRRVLAFCTRTSGYPILRSLVCDESDAMPNVHQIDEFVQVKWRRKLVLSEYDRIFTEIFSFDSATECARIFLYPVISPTRQGILYRYRPHALVSYDSTLDIHARHYWDMKAACKVNLPADMACEAADALPHEALREKILLYRFAAREQNPDAAYKLASYLVYRFGADAMIYALPYYYFAARQGDPAASIELLVCQPSTMKNDIVWACGVTEQSETIVMEKVQKLWQQISRLSRPDPHDLDTIRLAFTVPVKELHFERKANKSVSIACRATTSIEPDVDFDPHPPLKQTDSVLSSQYGEVSDPQSVVVTFYANATDPCIPLAATPATFPEEIAPPPTEYSNSDLFFLQDTAPVVTSPLHIPAPNPTPTSPPTTPMPADFQEDSSLVNSAKSGHKSALPVYANIIDDDEETARPALSLSLAVPENATPRKQPMLPAPLLEAASGVVVVPASIASIEDGRIVKDKDVGVPNLPTEPVAQTCSFFPSVPLRQTNSLSEIWLQCYFDDFTSLFQQEWTCLPPLEDGCSKCRSFDRATPWGRKRGEGNDIGILCRGCLIPYIEASPIPLFKIKVAVCKHFYSSSVMSDFGQRYPGFLLFIPFGVVQAVDLHLTPVSFATFKRALSYIMANEDFAHAVYRFAATPCFYWHLSSEAAAALVREKPGYFLVRFSSIEANYAVTVCKRDGKARHVRIEMVQNKTQLRLICSDQGANAAEAKLASQHFPCLKSALAAARAPLHLEHPLPIAHKHQREMVDWARVMEFRRMHGDLLGMGREDRANIDS